MEGEEEQPPQEGDVEPIVTVGVSEVVPRVLAGEAQNLSDADALTLLLEMKLRRRRGAAQPAAHRDRAGGGGWEQGVRGGHGALQRRQQEGRGEDHPGGAA
ncbi:TraB domain-containing protein [Vulpes lagopus]